MSLSNEIVLRPRFKFEADGSSEILLQGFEDAKKSQSDFIVTRIDDHVFVKFPKQVQHFWSPQLHLEINEKMSKALSLMGFLDLTQRYGPCLCFFTLLWLVSF